MCGECEFPYVANENVKSMAYKIKYTKIAIMVHTQTFIAASVPFGSHFTAHKLRATNSCAKLSANRPKSRKSVIPLSEIIFYR